MFRRRCRHISCFGVSLPLILLRRDADFRHMLTGCFPSTPAACLPLRRLMFRLAAAAAITRLFFFAIAAITPAAAAIHA